MKSARVPRMRRGHFPDLFMSRRKFLGLGAGALAAVGLGSSAHSRPFGSAFYEPEVRSSSGGFLSTRLRAATGPTTVQGDTVMAGYWNDPEGTAKALRDGWLWTGDVGAFDEEGLLTLKDRSKDMIISGGSNIYPREIEDVLSLHPAVAECSVVGRPHPEWGEEVVAFVVARAEAVPSSHELDALCLDHIARFKRPKRYVFVQSLPKNNYGKVLKTELRRLLGPGPQGRP